MKNEFIEDIRQKLKGELPGREAQYEMSHAIRRNYKSAPEDARIACVMCLFYEKNGEPHISLFNEPLKILMIDMVDRLVSQAVNQRKKIAVIKTLRVAKRRKKLVLKAKI